MKKKYGLTIEFDTESNQISVESENENFNALELLGLITWKQSDVIKQLNGEIEPDCIKRKVIKD